MKWYLRKDKKSSVTFETPPTPEPKRSILRWKSRGQEPNINSNITNRESELSLVDLRSDNSLTSSSGSLRTLNGSGRRNVLFLDELQRSKKSSVSRETGIRSMPVTPSANLTRYASYPASYQPSLLASKNDSVDNEIELVSRTHVPPMRNDTDGDIWVNSVTKQAVAQLVMGRWRRGRRQSEQPTANGNLETSTVDGLNASPQAVHSSTPTPLQLFNNPQRFSSSRSFVMLGEPRHDSPTIRRPDFPKMIESKASCKPNSNKSTPNPTQKGLTYSKSMQVQSAPFRPVSNATSLQSNSYNATPRPQSEDRNAHTLHSSKQHSDDLFHIHLTNNRIDTKSSHHKTSSPTTPSLISRLSASQTSNQQTPNPFHSVHSSANIFMSRRMPPQSPQASKPLHPIPHFPNTLKSCDETRNHTGIITSIQRVPGSANVPYRSTAWTSSGSDKRVHIVRSGLTEKLGINNR